MSTSPDRRGVPRGRANEGRVVGEKSDAGFHKDFNPDAPPPEAMIDAHREDLRSRGLSEEVIALAFPRRTSLAR